MLVALSATTKKFLSRPPLAALYSRMSQAQSGVSSGLQPGIDGKPVVIPYSSRLQEARALTQDVWTIFKYVLIHVARFTYF